MKIWRIESSAGFGSEGRHGLSDESCDVGCGIQRGEHRLPGLGFGFPKFWVRKWIGHGEADDDELVVLNDLHGGERWDCRLGL